LWGRLPVGLSLETPILKLAYLKSKTGFAQRARREQASRRKRPFYSRRRDTPVFVRSKDQKQGSHRGHREHRESRHRGVSAFSFRDGAIPRFSFVQKIKKQGSHRGHREHGEDKHRGVIALSIRDGAIPRFSFVPKIKTGFTQRAQRARRKNWQRARALPEKEKTALRQVTRRT